MTKPSSRVSGVAVRGPLGPFADAYREELYERGYTRWTVASLLRQMGRLSGWLESRGLAAARLDGGRVEEFLAFQRAGGRYRPGWSRRGLWCLLEVLGWLGELEPVEPVLVVSATEELLASFEAYLSSERALVPGTVRAYVGHARRFLGGLPSEAERAQGSTGRPSDSNLEKRITRTAR